MSRCDICIDQKCKGAMNCNCENCDKNNVCHRILHPTIRITNKCTQTCPHCCFSCSPQLNTHMSIEMSISINKFLISNNINVLNIMGGEFFCNPNWSEVIGNLSNKMKRVRIVTNSDWAASPKDVIEFMNTHLQCYFSLSKDKWHTNEYVNAAMRICKENNIKCIIAKEDQTTDDSIVPVGRSLFEYGFYSTFGMYCQNPKNMYSFLIDEIGEISKCSFGLWKYANINEYLEGDFCIRFKEFNTKFYKCWIGSCKDCNRIYAKNQSSNPNKPFPSCSL